MIVNPLSPLRDPLAGAVVRYSPSLAHLSHGSPADPSFLPFSKAGGAAVGGARRCPNGDVWCIFFHCVPGGRAGGIVFQEGAQGALAIELGSLHVGREVPVRSPPTASRASRLRSCWGPSGLPGMRAEPPPHRATQRADRLIFGGRSALGIYI